ncbi:unnamed protein product [Trypanosoma congolense IL3000]|uniref:WGS project CAEQ00000000 data, annotated contig 481 n=1 Tax=Trypanosoma congolense (strain IL3000) TaxID=1068625 RepID=F9WG98_TRYCI|nr:unnamed protein product [Trypanosoma congolense IL3000]
MCWFRLFCSQGTSSGDVATDIIDRDPRWLHGIMFLLGSAKNINQSHVSGVIIEARENMRMVKEQMDNEVCEMERFLENLGDLHGFSEWKNSWRVVTQAVKFGTVSMFDVAEEEVERCLCEQKETTKAIQVAVCGLRESFEASRSDDDFGSIGFSIGAAAPSDNKISDNGFTACVDISGYVKHYKCLGATLKEALDMKGKSTRGVNGDDRITGSALKMMVREAADHTTQLADSLALLQGFRVGVVTYLSVIWTLFAHLEDIAVSNGDGERTQLDRTQGDPTGMTGATLRTLTRNLPIYVARESLRRRVRLDWDWYRPPADILIVLLGCIFSVFSGPVHTSYGSTEPYCYIAVAAVIITSILILAGWPLVPLCTPYLKGLWRRMRGRQHKPRGVSEATCPVDGERYETFMREYGGGSVRGQQQMPDDPGLSHGAQQEARGTRMLFDPSVNKSP